MGAKRRAFGAPLHNVEKEITDWRLHFPENSADYLTASGADRLFPPLT